MHVPLLDRSIRWKLLLSLVGAVALLQIAVLLVRHHGATEAMVGVTASLGQAMESTSGHPPDASVLAAMQNALQAAQRRQFVREGVAALAVAGAMVVLVILVANSLVRPLHTLTRRAHALAAGDFSSTPDL